MRTLTPVLVSLALLSLTPGGVDAQTMVGGLAGRTWSRQIIDRSDDSSTRAGNVLGGFIFVPTPAGHLSILAEAFYAQRGGRLAVANTSLGDVQSDMIGVTVAPTVHVGVGPMSAYLYGGPMVETPVRNRFPNGLEGRYQTPAGQILAVTAGAGISFDTGPWSIGVEARVVEELTSAFLGDTNDSRHRAKEILVRVGKLRAR